MADVKRFRVVEHAGCPSPTTSGHKEPHPVEVMILDGAYNDEVAWSSWWGAPNLQMMSSRGSTRCLDGWRKKARIRCTELNRWHEEEIRDDNHDDQC